MLKSWKKGQKGEEREGVGSHESGLGRAVFPALH